MFFSIEDILISSNFSVATEKLDEIRISSIEKNNTQEREGEFLRYLPNSVFWHFDEPENLLRSYPLIFHETGNQVSEKANLSLIWKLPN